MMGATTIKQPRAEEGDTVAFGRLDHVATGESFTDAKGTDTKMRAASGNGAALPKPTPPEPVHALALKVRDRNMDSAVLGRDRASTANCAKRLARVFQAAGD